MSRTTRPLPCRRWMSDVVWGCTLLVLGCGIDPSQSSGAIASAGAGGSLGTAAAAGVAGRSDGGTAGFRSAAGGHGGGAAVVSWSCGVAAGACTCVRVEAPLSGTACPASECCSVDPSGDCTCRLGDPAPDCDSLMRAFGATEQVSGCPL